MMKKLISLKEELYNKELLLSFKSPKLNSNNNLKRVNRYFEYSSTIILSFSNFVIFISLSNLL